MTRETNESASELRAIAALIVTEPSPTVIGPCTLVTNGERTVAFSSSELLRAAPEPLAIALTHDLTRTLPVAAWSMSRSSQMGLIDLGTSFPADAPLDVAPVPIGAVVATVDTRGAPAALVTVRPAAAGFVRHVIPVHVDTVDGGATHDDVITHLASPAAPVNDADIDGAALVAWLPADPLLGRPAEVVIVALGCTYPHRTYQPREQAAIAELFGLEDLGRVLPYRRDETQPTNELPQIAGEIAVGDVEGD